MDGSNQRVASAASRGLRAGKKTVAIKVEGQSAASSTSGADQRSANLYDVASRLERRQGIDGDGDAFEDAFQHQIPTHHTLEPAHDQPIPASFQQFTHDD